MTEQAELADSASETAPEATGPEFAMSTPIRPRRSGLRRFLRFNLLTALISLLIVSAFFGMRQRFVVPPSEIAARATLTGMGARITMKPGGPEWIRQTLLIPESSYQYADEVSFDPEIEGFYCQIGEPQTATDPRLKAIGELSRLRSLDLWISAIDDDALRYTARCESLQHLSWSSSGITDDGIESLRTLRELRSIKLGSSFVSDRSLEALADLPELTSIVLDSSTTERGIAALLRYPKLKLVDATLTSLRKKDVQALIERGIAVELPIPTPCPVVVPAKLDVVYFDGSDVATDASAPNGTDPIKALIPSNLDVDRQIFAYIDPRYGAIACEFVGLRPDDEALRILLEDPRVVGVDLPFDGFPYRQEELRALARHRPADAPHCRVHGNVLISGEELLEEAQYMRDSSMYLPYDVDAELERRLHEAGVLLFRDCAFVDAFAELRRSPVADSTEPGA